MIKLFKSPIFNYKALTNIMDIIKLAEKIGYKLASFTEKNKSKYIVYKIKPYKNSEKGIENFIDFLKSFKNLKHNIYFYIKGNGKQISLFVKIPPDLSNFFENIFYANFPEAELEKTKNNIILNFNTNKFINFENKDFLTYKEFITEKGYLGPFKEILSLYNDIPTTNNLIIQLKYNFNTTENIILKILKFILKLFKSKKEIKKQEKEEEIQFHRHINFSIGIKVNSKDKILKEKIITNLTNIYTKFLKEGKVKISKKEKKFNATFEEVANFFYLPNKELFIKSLEYVPYKKLPYPPNLPTLENTDKNEITLLGYTDYKNDNIKFGIKKEDKFRHIYIIGKTGMGKSTLISNMVRSDLITNNGVAVIDPHGDLIDTILQHIPSWRINDVILFDVSDFDYPIGFNILQTSSKEEKIIIVSGIISTFKKLYGDSRGPRLEYILRNTLLSIINYPNATLLHLTRMLTDKNFKEEVLKYVNDPIILKFWRNEFDKWSENFRNEAVSPIVNKVGQFLSSPIVRNIFGQPKTKLNIRKIMDEGKILLVNLSKGKIGEDNAQMIGSFLVTKFQIDAMARADIPIEKRKDFYLYIDEFQNFATDSFESILSEARKYKLSLIVANQYISQIDEKIRNAIFGNVGTIISFGLGYDDAQIISNQFKELISTIDLLSLPKFKAYTKLMIDGIVYDPFSMKTFPLPNPEQGPEIKEKVRTQSRQRYAMESKQLEKLIHIWAEKKFNPVEKAIEKAKNIQKQSHTIDKNITNNNKNSSKSSDIIKLSDIIIGKRYKGIVKLKYNYGLFIMLPGGEVEGLLHKKKIKVPEGIRWKDLYNIGDTIDVKAEGFKEVDGEKKVIWTQLED